MGNESCAYLHALALLFDPGSVFTWLTDRACRTLKVLQAHQRQTLTFASPHTVGCVINANKWLSLHVSISLLTLTSDLGNDLAVVHAVAT